MSNSCEAVAQRWVDRITGKSTRPELPNPRVPIIGGNIHSFGSHFEMARPLRDKKGVQHSWLLNGDRFSPTTDRHQRTVRDVLTRTGLPMVIIPHDALRAAGVDRDSIQLIDVSADRHEIIPHVAYTKPESAEWVEDPIYGDVDLTDAEIEALLDKRHRQAWSDYEARFNNWTRLQARIAADPECWAAQCPPQPKPTAPARATRESLGSYDLREWRQTGTRMVLRFKSWHSGSITVAAVPDGRTRYSWTTSQHFLGESLIRARTEWRQTTKCKACAGTGRLKEYRGVTRHDIPWGTVYQCEPCFGRGNRTRTCQRWSYYLSGFDMNEPRPLYFFAELPRTAKPKTIAEAYEDLKPEPVKMAEQMGRPVARQGDIFAIPITTVDKRTLRKQGARFEKRGALLGQNHEGSEVAYLPDGTTLVRGVLWHNPAGRPPDHRRVRLSPGWHVVIKNSVPVAA